MIKADKKLFIMSTILKRHGEVILKLVIRYPVINFIKIFKNMSFDHTKQIYLKLCHNLFKVCLRVMRVRVSCDSMDSSELSEHEACDQCSSIIC